MSTRKEIAFRVVPCPCAQRLSAVPGLWALPWGGDAVSVPLEAQRSTLLSRADFQGIREIY